MSRETHEDHPVECACGRAAPWLDSPERYAEVARRAGIGLLTWSPDPGDVALDPCAAALLGGPRPGEEEPLESLLLRLAPGDGEELRRALGRALGEGVTVTVHARTKASSGDPGARDLEIRVLPPAEQSGAGVRILATCWETAPRDVAPGTVAPRGELCRTYLDTIAALSRTIERRDPYTAGHQQRVAEIAVLLAADLGMSEEEVLGIRVGSMIHDIGKSCVPIELLNRPDVLSPPEFDLVRAHAQLGYEILKDVAFPWPVPRMVLEHHERLDGSGYPNRVTGDAIHPASRVVAVADVVDAITSDRPYRPGLGVAAALDEIEDRAGVAYDEDVVRACARLFRDPRGTFAREFARGSRSRSAWGPAR